MKAQLPHVYNYWKGGGPLEQNCIPISRNARISKDLAETGFDGPRILNAWNARIQILLKLRLTARLYIASRPMVFVGLRKWR